jgi:hypothetical protein
VLSDRIGHLPRRQAGNRQNPFKDPVREVRVATETGKILRLLSNDLDAPAQEIADLYKRRWAIELFFAGSSRTSRSAISSAPARMRCASRSPWRSSPIFC